MTTIMKMINRSRITSSRFAEFVKVRSVNSHSLFKNQSKI